MSALISAEELAATLPDHVLLDVQWNLAGPPGAEEYARGHLPGAHFLDLATDLAAPPGEGGRHPLPPMATVQAALRRAGVHPDSSVVVYDGSTGWGSARAWWVLRYAGLRTVRVLDGGLAAWRESGGEVNAEVPAAPGDGTFEASVRGMPVLDAKGAQRMADKGVLLDARAPQRYSGAEEPMDPVAGHIPGAVSLPTTGNLAADGRLLPADELRERFAAAGVQEGRPVGTYCGSGVSAAQQVLALHEAGFDAALYVGSWSDWVTDPDRPVATGPEPR